MIKVKTTDDTYKSVVLRRAIIICWLLLFVCFALKIFGGNYFEIVVNSPNFVAFCEYLDSNIVLYGLIGLISAFVSYSLYYLAIFKQIWFSKKQFIVFIITVVVFCIARIILMECNCNNFAFIFDIIQYFIVPFALNYDINKKNILRVIIAFSYNFAFQLIAVITKNIGIKLTTDNPLVAIIYMIDLYIMLVLYYLYSNNKKGNEKNGIICRIFLR